MSGAGLLFNNQVVVIAGAGNGTGEKLAGFFASRGASVLFNDENASFADSVVTTIRKSGGKATAGSFPNAKGDKIIDRAIQTYGSIHVLINNPACRTAQHTSFKDLSDAEWDTIQKTYVFGAYKTARAAWSYFKKQKYGRIVNITGQWGINGQASHTTAEFSLVGFTETLAKEGSRNNIIANLVISRPFASNLVISLAAILTYQSVNVNGAIFDIGFDSIAKLQWKRSKPVMLKADTSLTASAVLKQWEKIGDFSNQDRNPDGPLDGMELLRRSQLLPTNASGEKVDFGGQVAIVTGAGNGIGRQYALRLAELGAKVVVNDLANPQAVVNEIKALGGQALCAAFGGLHILINNAGILRDKSFQAMTDDLWNIIQAVHLRGSYKTLRAAWPIFLKQGYGRVVNTTSVSGIYGNFGQSNYAAAKCGIIGLSAALSEEGRKHNIRINTVAPSAGTQLTRTVMPEEIIQALKPDYVAPFVVALLSENLPGSSTGGLYEIGSGSIAMDKFQRTSEHTFPATEELTPESLLSAWSNLVTLATDINYSERIKQYRVTKSAPKRYSYAPKDVLLYNLGVQAKATEPKWVFEDCPDFEVLPTFGVIPYFDPSIAGNLGKILPNFSMSRVLHGEQYLEIRKFPIPISGSLLTYPSLVEIVDKSKAAIVVHKYRTTIESTGEDMFYVEETTFIRGSGNFGGQKHGTDRGAATAANDPPPRKPDVTIVETTSPNAAALYRLSGDTNPLHIDPAVAKAGGLDRPILHGLCTFGISGKHIYSTFGPFRNIKARFINTVLPGQTLQTDMWKENGKVIFQTTILETGKLALAAAAVTLVNTKPSL